MIQAKKLWWQSPQDVTDYACVYCLVGEVEKISPGGLSEQHWQCNCCDSTFPSWLYPLGYGEQCALWNNAICEDCDFVGTGVMDGMCVDCRNGGTA